jgi:hypothetical protein
MLRRVSVPRLHGLGDALVLGPGLARDLLVGRRVGMMPLFGTCEEKSKVFEAYWTTILGVDAMDKSCRFDLTVYGRQEAWEDSPNGLHRGKNFTVATTCLRPVFSPEGQCSDDLRTGRR